MLLLFVVSLLIGGLAHLSAGKHQYSIVKDLATNLKVHYEVIQNPTASITSLCRTAQAGDGLCAKVNLEFSYTGNNTINNTEWVIYIHSIRRILKVENDVFSVEHVTGDLHTIRPSTSFSKFAPDTKLVLPMIVEFWIISYSDIMPNMFVSHRGTAENIASTGDIEQLGIYASGITGDNRKRLDDDETVFMNPETRFEQNKQNKIFLLSPDQVEKVIIPTPKEVKAGTGHANLSNGIYLTGCVWRSFEPQTKKAIIDKFESFGINILKSAPVFTPEAYFIMIEQPAQPFGGDEIDPYSLQIGKHLTVIRGEKSGAFYALQSFLSLIQVGSTWVPVVDVLDSARFTHRGIMADVARNFKSKEVIFQLLDQMAYYKLNTFHLHASDDEGWRIEIPGLEELTEYGSRRCINSSICLLPQLGSGADTDNQGSGYYSVEDYEDIIRYANARFIKVIPEFDMPGHSRAAVLSMERRYTKFIDVNKTKAEQYRLLDPGDTSNILSVQFYDRTTALNPCMPSTYSFVEKVISEVQVMHQKAGQPLKEWHFGGDEARNVLLGGGYKDYNYSVPQHRPWENSPVCTESNAVIEELPIQYLKRVNSILQSRGITIMHAWSDAVGHPPSNASNLGQDIRLTLWDTLQWGAAERAQQLAEAGFQLVNAMPDFIYFDMPHEANPFERGYYWATRFVDLRKVFSFAPVCISQNAEYSLTRLGKRQANQTMEKLPANLFHGMQGNVWTETIRTDNQFEYMSFPRLIALAERAWHVGSWEESEENCKGTIYGFSPEGKPLHDSLDKINRDFNLFANVIGQRELAKLDLAKVKYRLPLAGYRIGNGQLEANIEIPGVKIEYSIDDGKTWKTYNDSEKPSFENEAKVTVRSVSPDGTRFRIEVIEPARKVTPTPEELCAKDPNKLYPYPPDCSKYIQCVFETPVIRDCPPSTLFDPALRICNHPENVKCLS